MFSCVFVCLFRFYVLVCMLQFFLPFQVARKAEALQVKLQSHVRFHDGESEEET